MGPKDFRSVQFTTFKFYPTVRSKKGKLAPTVDYYNQEAQLLAVAATAEHQHIVAQTRVPKEIWIEPAGGGLLPGTAWAVTVHFGYTWTEQARVDPVDQARKDAIQVLTKLFWKKVFQKFLVLAFNVWVRVWMIAG